MYTVRYLSKVSFVPHSLTCCKYPSARIVMVSGLESFEDKRLSRQAKCNQIDRINPSGYALVAIVDVHLNLVLEF